MINPIKGIDAIAVIDTSQQERVKRIYEFENNTSRTAPFFHIGQGINTNIFCPPESAPQTESPKEQFTIIYVGKLNFSKGVPQLIEAFKQLRSEEKIPSQLLLVGSGKGEQKDKIYAMAQDMDNIQFLGQIEQEKLSQYFRKSDLFVLPSFYEGFPNVLLEALSSGCRAIITDLPGIKDTLQKTCGESDFIQYLPLPEMDSIDKPKQEELPDFVDNLRNLMKAQLEKCNTSQKSYSFAKRVKSEFSWEGLFQKYLKKYDDLLSKDVGEI
jgi:glycosyltransferase involved in cell wall biosynthesis